MASLSRCANGRRIIQFTGPDGRRHSIRLGKIGQRAAEEVRRHVEYLYAAKLANAPIDAGTAAWLEGVGDVLRDRIAAVGLCDSLVRSTVGSFLDDYLAGRTDLKNPLTRRTYEYAMKRLKKILGADTDLRAIDDAKADAWLVRAKTDYADATVAQDLIFARQFWRAAVKRRLAAANPFDGLRGPKTTNDARHHYVDHATSLRILDACQSWQWRLIFSLSRWGGFRTPSEHRSLTWDAVLFDLKRIRATGKTGPRWLPLFPELAGPLDEAWDHAREGESLVLPGLEKASLLRWQFTRILKRLGIEPWERLFHNLRSTRQTELEDQGVPSKVVADWLGNSPAVARRHYLQPTDSWFAWAVGGGAKCGAPTPEAVQKPMHAPKR